MTVTQTASEDSLAMSLEALTEAAEHASSDRDDVRAVLARVEPRWADDAAAWSLVQRLVVLARRRTRDLERTVPGRGNQELARARWAHDVTLGLYEDLRVRALRAYRRV